jgi:general secretion pathway protein D
MKFSSSALRALPASLVVLLGACAQPPLTLPGPINFPRSPRNEANAITEATPTERRQPETGVAVMPSVGSITPAPVGAPAPGTPAGADEAEEVSIAIEQTPLPMFIQILYGNVLKRPYSIDPAVSSRTDVVTFKTSRPLTRSRMEQIAVSLLKSYQVSVQDLDGLIRIVPETAQSAVPPPVLRFGRTLPQTPEALRTAFHYVDVDVVRVSEVTQTLRQVLGTRVNVQEDVARNGLLLSGNQNDLRTALELIQSLDQPRMRGRIARRITPAFLNTTEFSTRLAEVLSAQGYATSTGASGTTPILLIPIPAIGSVMVFANTEASMEMVLKWSRELDRPISAQTQNGLYTYPVKYADALELARTLGEILGTPTAAAVAPATAAGGPNASPGVNASAAARPPSGSRVVVNSATNTLIIRGTNADEYQQIQALLRELDRPVKSALIEVVVAELRVGGSQALGIEWNVPVREVNSGKNLVTAGTLGRLGIGSGGFSLSLGNSAGQIIAQLNTLASANQARILSNPKVMARNGETASIQVGQEVPVVTSQQSSGTGGLLTGTQVLQQITYRSTGVILRVRPVINSGNRLDLDVSQEVSSAAETRTGVSASPTISTRRIETKLSLRDGSTVLLGGLISKAVSDANTGVPYLKDIPGLGAFFRTQSDSNDQTELLIMITPYVVSDDFESEAITEAIQKSFGDWAQDLKASRVVERPAAAKPLPDPSAVPRVDVVPPAVIAPPPAQTPSSQPAPVVPISSALPPQPEPRPLAPTPNDGVTLSAPAAASAPSGADPSKPDRGGVPTDNKSPADASSPPGKAPPAPPVPSKPVTDPQVRKEFEEFLKKRRQ